MDSLDQILTDHEVVFLDTSLVDLSGYDLDSFTSFQQLNPKKLKLKEKCMADFLMLLKNPSARTIPEITREIRAYVHKLRSNMVNLANPEDRNKSRYQKNQDILNRAVETAVQCEEASAEKEFVPGNQAPYKLLVEMVKLLTAELELKKGYSAQHKKPRRVSDTDERIVASLYYTALERRTPILISRDTHFPTLLRTTPKLMGSDVFLPDNREFRQALVFNPFKLFLCFDGKFEPSIDYKHPWIYDSGFDPKLTCGDESGHFTKISLPTDRSQDLRSRLAQCWERYSPVFN